MTSGRRSLVLSAKAGRDLDDILLYSLRTWGEQQKDAYKAAIDRTLQDLIDFPELGRRRPEFGRGARSLPVEQHVIVYRVTRQAIVVSRILHARRDIERILRRKTPP